MGKLAMGWNWKNILKVTMRLILRVLVYGLLIFFSISAVLSTIVAFLVGRDTPPYPGEYIELALFYDFLFLAMIGMALVAWRRSRQAQASGKRPPLSRQPGLSWLRPAGLILQFFLATLLMLLLWDISFWFPDASRLLRSLTGMCGILAVFALLLTALYWLAPERSFSKKENCPPENDSLEQDKEELGRY
jgi:hypothetical protein